MTSRKILSSSCRQLTSLLDWTATQRQSHQSTRIAQSSTQIFQSRYASSNPNSIQYSKERKEHDKKLSELRKQWAQDHQQRLQEKAAQVAAELSRRQAAKSNRDRADAAIKETKLKEIQAQQQADRALRQQAKVHHLQRQELRTEILDAAREERKQTLLRQSAQWVEPEHLDQRIEEALDNPVPLWP